MSTSDVQYRRPVLFRAVLIVASLLPAGLLGAQEVGDGPAATQAGDDPVKRVYLDYVPSFLVADRRRGQDPARWLRDEKEMKLSSEPTFFTLNLLDQDSRADALVQAALNQEAKGQYRDALKMYQIVIEKYPHVLYRVSQHGVFVPISQYCQRRILGFPPNDLAFYRSLYDAKAKEAFEQARRQYSLIGLSEIVDTMLATSYGGRAIIELGNAALDSGHYLAALEAYTTVRDFFPDPALKTDELALKIQHCRGMLGRPIADKAPPAGKSDLSEDHLARLRAVVASAKFTPATLFSQFASAPNIACDDYVAMPPSTDPLGLKPLVWQQTLPGSRNDNVIYSQPVITENSVIYRHKNIVYCRSILNGELRWVQDVGGRAVWQNREERMYPQEDLLVQDGLVFTAISKAGPSLVAPGRSHRPDQVGLRPDGRLQRGRSPHAI